MPKSNGRPKNRQSKKWRLVASSYTDHTGMGITTWPWQKKGQDGKQAPNLNVTYLRKGA